MSVVTQRKPALQAPSSIKANSINQQFEDGNTAAAWLWYPTNKKSITFLTMLKSYLMEYVASLVLIFLVVFSVVSAVANTADMGIRSLLVALVGFGSYYMVTGWLRMPDSELPRHASWLVTVSHMMVLRFGILHGLIYLVAQTLGALTASGILSAFGPGATVEAWVPQIADTTARSWAAEIIGSSLIVFSLLYNHMAGVPNDLEQDHQREGEVMASAMRGVATLIFFRLGHWSYDPAIYLGGLFATCWNGGCLSDSTANHLSAAFFILVPMIGMVVAVALYLLGVLLSTSYGKERTAKGVRLEKPIQHTQYVKVSE